MRLRPITTAWLLAALIGPSLAAAGPLYFSAKPAARAMRGHYAVIGEVVRPGVYAGEAAMTVGDLLAAAGNVTSRQCGTARLFRDGRQVQQVFLATGGATPLVPGDLVDVPRRHVAAESKEPPALVDLALVQLLDVPVVISVPRERATVLGVVEFLGQRDDVAAKVRVLSRTPIESRRLGTWRTLASRSLEPGTVLVFPTQLVRYELLPDLPSAFELPKAPSTVAAPPRPSLSTLPKPTFAVPTTDTWQPAKSPAAPALPAPSPAARVAKAIVSPVMTAMAEPPQSAEATPSSATIAKAAEIIKEDGALAEAAAFIGTHFLTHSTLHNKAEQLFGLDQKGQMPAESRSAELKSTFKTVVFSPALPIGRRLNRSGIFIFFGIVGGGTLAAIGGVYAVVWSIARVSRWVLNRLNGEEDEMSFNAAPLVIPPAPIPRTVRDASRKLRIDAGQPVTRLSIDLSAIDPGGERGAEIAGYFRPSKNRR